MPSAWQALSNICSVEELKENARGRRPPWKAAGEQWARGGRTQNSAAWAEERAAERSPTVREAQALASLETAGTEGSASPVRGGHLYTSIGNRFHDLVEAESE